MPLYLRKFYNNFARKLSAMFLFQFETGLYKNSVLPNGRNMKTDFHLSEHHLFSMFGKHILFNVGTMLFYEVTPLISDMVTLLASGQAHPLKALKKKYSKSEIKNALQYMEKEGFIKKTPIVENKPALKKRLGIRHLELMVTHGCNMRCRYCYGAHGAEEWETAPHLYGASSKGMPFETARAGVDFLFRASGGRKEVSIVFFGGEPLLEFDLITRLVPYIREKEVETGKKADLSLSTNGLLLSRKVVDFLVRNRIGCQVSIDGPREIQDRNRCLPEGTGSYDLVLPGLKRLVSARPGKVPVRVTMAHGTVRLPEVVEHLLSLGVGSVHVEPDIGSFVETAITEADVEAIKRQNEALALFLVGRVRQNKYFNYANLVKYIRQTRVVRDRSAHYCGAGRTYFSLSQDGAFYPCHRFVGMDAFRMGDLETGMDTRLQKKIVNLTVDDRPECGSCWARYLCGGGCWQHAVERNGSLETPDTRISCEITKHVIECAMAINSELNVSDKDVLSELYDETVEPQMAADAAE